MIISFCCTLLVTLVQCCSLSWKFCQQAVCGALLCVVGAGSSVDRQVGPSPFFPRSSVVSGMSSPGVTTLGSLVAPSSGSGRKATCKMPLHLSWSASFILHISVTELTEDALGFIFGVGYITFLLPFLNLLSLISWPSIFPCYLILLTVQFFP